MRTWMYVAAGVLALSASPRISHAAREGEVVAVPHVGSGRGVAVADDGTRYLTGAIEDPSSAEKARRPFLSAVDLQGQVRWQQIWEGAGRAAAVAATAAGPVALVVYQAPPFDADPGAGVRAVEMTDGRDAVAVALTPAGALRWTWSTPGTTLTAIAALPDGSVAIAGSTPDFLGFVAVVDARGGTSWHRRLARGDAYPHALAVSEAGIFVTGIGSTAPPGVRSTQGGFVARLGLDGELRWLRRLGSRGSTLKGYAVAADEHRVAIGGLFRDRPDFDPGRRRLVRESVDSDDDGFVAVFDKAGALQWVYTFGAASSDQVRGLAIDGGKIYALGNQTEVVDLGGAAGALDPRTKWFLLTLDERGAPGAVEPVLLGKPGSYPSMYVGSMIAHHGRALIMGEISDHVTVLGRTFSPVRFDSFGAPGGSPLMIDLAMQ